jgi:kinesin family member 1
MRRAKEPHLTNLNEDPILSYVICHFIDSKELRIGRSNNCKIQLTGLSILSEHAIVASSNSGQVTIRPAQIGAKIKVNGIQIDGSRVLEHKDRILFGS